MFSRTTQQLNSDVPNITLCEERSKQALGILESSFMAVGFTSGNFLHFVTPVIYGGLGLAVISFTAAICTLIIIGVTTLILTILIAYSLLRILEPEENDIQTLYKKQDEVKKKQLELFARLLNYWHLLSKIKHGQALKPKMQRKIQIMFNVDDEVAAILVNKVEKLYVVMERELMVNEDIYISEKKIKHYLLTNHERFAEDLNRFTRFYTKPPPPKNCQPLIIGLFAGFLSFINMSSGLLGTYSSLVAIITAVTTIQLAIPMIGWIFFAVSLLVGIGIGWLMKHLTERSIKRQIAIADVQAESNTLTECLVKIHDSEIDLLNRHRAQNERRATDAEAKLREVETKVIEANARAAAADNRASILEEKAIVLEDRIMAVENRARIAEMKTVVAEHRIKQLLADNCPNKSASPAPSPTEPLFRSMSHGSLFKKESFAKKVSASNSCYSTFKNR